MTDWSVTVIVPAYNHEKFISNGLRSIAQQDVFPSVKLLIADDVSSDRTFEIASEFSEHYPNVSVYRNPENLGLIGNYEALAMRCDTEFVAVLEGDDFWIASDKLRKQLEFLENNAGINGCFSEFYLLTESTGTLQRRPPWADGRYRILNFLDILYDNASATFSTCCYRTSSFQRAITDLRGAKVADWAVNMLISRPGGFGFVPGAAVVYRLHEAGLWSGLSLRSKDEWRQASLKAVQGFMPEYTCYVKDNAVQPR